MVIRNSGQAVKNSTLFWRVSMKMPNINKRNLWYSGFIILVLFLIPTHALSQDHTPVTYYVSPTGSDSNDGLSESSPLKDLAKAMYGLQLGDTLIILPGDYTVVDFKAWPKDRYRKMMYLGPEGGDPNIRTTIKGKDGAARPKILVKNSKGYAPKIEIKGGTGITFENLEVIDGEIGYGNYFVYRNCEFRGGGNSAYAIHAEHHHALIENCYFHKIHGGSDAIAIYITGDDNVIRNNFFKDLGHHGINSNSHGNNSSPSERWIIEGNYFTQTGGHGIGLQNTQDFIIRNNVLVNVGSQAISFGGHVFPDKNVKVIGNTIYNFDKVGSYGFLFINDIEGIVVEDNILVHRTPVAFLNSSSQLSPVKMKTYTFRNNLYFNPYRDGQPIFFPTNDSNYHLDVKGWQQYTADIMGGTGLEQNSLNVAPDVASPPNSGTDYLEYNGSSHIDVSPKSGSPLIDAGVATALLTKDIKGTPRPQGSGYDIGAYEYNGSGGGSTEEPPTASPPEPPGSLQIIER